MEIGEGGVSSVKRRPSQYRLRGKEKCGKKT